MIEGCLVTLRTADVRVLTELGKTQEQERTTHYRSPRHAGGVDTTLVPAPPPPTRFYMRPT